MKKLFSILIISLIPSFAYAGNFKLLELDELVINYQNMSTLNPKARSMLIYPEYPDKSMNVIIKFDALKYLYWNSTIESLTTSAQYRSIGLQARAGIRIAPFLEVGLYHHSQHLMDRQHAYMPKFPVEDAIEINLYLYRRDKKSNIFSDIFGDKYVR